MFTRRPYGHCPIRVWGLLVAIALNHPVRAQTLPPGGYSLTAISLVGSEYNSDSDSTLLSLSDLGYGTGFTPRSTGGGLNLGEDAFAFHGTGPSHVANLTGPGYEYASGGGVFRRGRPVAMNNIGQIVGTSYRFDAGGTYQGRDVWIQSGSGSAELIGLVGPEYQPGTTRYSEVIAINDFGYVIGRTNRGGGVSVGSNIDAWLFDGSTTQLINPVGSVYELNQPGLNIRAGTLVALNGTGQVIGWSRRYGLSAENLGADAWLYTGPGPAKVISMTGTGYEGTIPSGQIVRSSIPSLINSSGQVAGSAKQYNGSGNAIGGNDIWLYDGVGQTKVVSLVGAPYETNGAGGVERDAFLQFLTPSGKVVGYNQRFRISEQVGQDAWYCNGVSTTAINLTGAGYEYTTTGAPGRYGMAQFVDDSGHVLGYSYRYTSSGSRVGQDVWYYGGGSTKVANLTGADYERSNRGGIERDGDTVAFNALGHGIGESVLYGAIVPGATVGQDSWFFDGSMSQRVNLAGPRYEYGSNGKVTRFSESVALNDEDQAIGYSLQYDANGSWIGQSGWFFDDATGVTTALDFSFAADGSSYSRPWLLTDSGVVLGSYFLFDGDAYDARLFWWSTEAGFHDFTDLIPGGINGAGWDNLSSLMGLDIPGAAGVTSTGSPEYIAGRGKITGQISAAQTLFLLSAQVPEPTFPLFAIVLLTALKRRPAAQKPKRE